MVIEKFLVTFMSMNLVHCWEWKAKYWGEGEVGGEEIDVMGIENSFMKSGRILAWQ